MIDADDTPSPHQLADNPELAILAALDRTLHMAVHALFAANPSLGAPDDCPHDDACAWTAQLLIVQARALTDSLAAYRDAVRVMNQWRARRLAAADI